MTRYAVIVKATREVSSIHQMEAGSKPNVRSDELEAIKIGAEVKVGDILAKDDKVAKAPAAETKPNIKGKADLAA